MSSGLPSTVTRNAPSTAKSNLTTAPERPGQAVGYMSLYATYTLPRVDRSTGRRRNASRCLPIVGARVLAFVDHVRVAVSYSCTVI
jgi:hypothetical protein